MPATTTRLKTAVAAAASSETRSPSKTPTPASPSTLPKTFHHAAKNRNLSTPKARKAGRDEEVEEETAEWKSLLYELQGRVMRLEAENEKLRGEVGGLRDKVEEQDFANKTLEKKIEEITREKEVAAGDPDERERPNEWKEELGKMEERLLRRVEAVEGGGGAAAQKRKCLILTDSNGRNATTPSSVLSHIPEESREDYEVEIVIAYHLQEILDKLEKNELSVQGVHVVIDCHSNDARNTRTGPALSPEALVRRVDELRQKLWDAGAAGIVVCAMKPTQRVDLREHNEAVHYYLRSKKDTDGGHGCGSQVLLEHLSRDGLHLQPRFYHVLQHTYACAISGTEVHKPTPISDFIPFHVRQQWERDWPRREGTQGEGGRPQNLNNGR